MERTHTIPNFIPTNRSLSFLSRIRCEPQYDRFSPTEYPVSMQEMSLALPRPGLTQEAVPIGEFAVGVTSSCMSTMSITVGKFEAIRAWTRTTSGMPKKIQKIDRADPDGANG